MSNTRDHDGRVTVSVWFADYPFSTYEGEPFLAPVRRMAAAFERAHPGYRIDVGSRFFPSMAGEIRDAVATGTVPHLAAYYAGDSRLALDQRAADGSALFTPVGRAIGDRTEILGEPVVSGDLLPAVRDFHSHGGELVSLPMTATTTVLYANTTLLARAGVDRLPGTWREVEHACRRIAALPDGPSHCITWAVHGWIVQQAVAQQGGTIADRGNGRNGEAGTVDLATGEILAYARWWRGLHRDGHYLDPGTEGDWAAAFAAFDRQQVAMVVDSSKSAEEFVLAGGRQGFDVAAGPMPHNEEAPYGGTFVSGDSFWLAGGLDPATEDGALAFLQFLINPENAAHWHRGNGFVPVTGAARRLLEDEGWFGRSPHRAVAGEQLAASTRTPAALGASLGNQDAIGEVLARAMADVVRGAAAEQRLRAATVEAQNVLDEYHASRRGEAGPPETARHASARRDGAARREPSPSVTVLDNTVPDPNGTRSTTP
ncbi:phosphate ABC transporter [Amycolatopsis antarctica]|uniref:Phosphate ABC transporter n=1 Tax=Amycolatopsis antarctica TaxID=1854586 RepID=A0A263D2N9_9PSEU|nr:extracellular solute-binding protein [Amycolatopsis antarctica]OZM71897.1 phosphate ABC transporter [Amycolatopsis antarctica]